MSARARFRASVRSPVVEREACRAPDGDFGVLGRLSAIANDPTIPARDRDEARAHLLRRIAGLRKVRQRLTKDSA